MKFYKLLDNERKALEKSIAKKEKYIKAAPDGVLRCYRCADHTKWYVVTVERPEKGKAKRHRKYLQKADRKLAEKLALKGFYEKELKDEKQELRAIYSYLNNCSKFEAGDRYLNNVEEYSKLLEPHFNISKISKDEEIRDWINTRNVLHEYLPEERVVPTKAGINVRSKSERDIVNLLLKNHLPFKYEDVLETDIGHLRPDFIVLNPKTGKEFVWEHHGIMDDPEYAARSFKKMAAYHRAGYHIGKKLIVTFEEKNEGIDEAMVEFMIKHIILEEK